MLAPPVTVLTFLAAAAVQAALVRLVNPMVLPLVEQGYRIAF
jgi:hypothetical protein